MKRNGNGKLCILVRLGDRCHDICEFGRICNGNEDGTQVWAELPHFVLSDN